MREKTKDKFYTLRLSLEQLYHGCSKTLQVTRKVVTEKELSEELSEELEVFVAKGSAHGDLIVAGKGDEQPGCDAGNLLVVLHEEAQ